MTCRSDLCWLILPQSCRRAGGYSADIQGLAKFSNKVLDKCKCFRIQVFYGELLSLNAFHPKPLWNL